MSTTPGSQYLARLLRQAAATPAVVAAYAGGPLTAAGGGGDVSAELSLWMVAGPEFGLDLVGWLQPLGETAFAGPVDDGFRVVTTDGLVIEIHVGEAIPAAVAGELQPVFNHSADGMPVASPGESLDLGESVGRFWSELYQAGAAIGRERPLAAHGALEACRAALLDLYRMALAPGRLARGWDGLDALPGGVAEWLVCPLDLRAQWRCATRLAATYESLVLPVTQRLGLTYPWSMRNLAFARLDSVGRMLAGAAEGGSAETAAPPSVDEAPPRAPAGPARFKVKARRGGGENDKTP